MLLLSRECAVGTILESLYFWLTCIDIDYRVCSLERLHLRSVFEVGKGVLTSFRIRCVNSLLPPGKKSPKICVILSFQCNINFFFNFYP